LRSVPLEVQELEFNPIRGSEIRGPVPFEVQELEFSPIGGWRSSGSVGEYLLYSSRLKKNFFLNIDGI
jgi:sporulation-control protein spo0M